MAITITRNGSHQLRRGTTVVSTHSDVKEAYERASREPNGTLTLVVADETIVVSGNGVTPPPPVNCAGHGQSLHAWLDQKDRVSMDREHFKNVERLPLLHNRLMVELCVR